MDRPAPRLDARALTADLARLGEAITRLIEPNEAAFTRLGSALGSARLALTDGGGLFHDLAGMLERGDQNRNVDEILRNAREQIESILAESGTIARSLDALVCSTEQVARPLATQAKIISEIAAIGINAKIHAAQINAHGIDFSVFTKDIDRLRLLADTCIQRAADLLHSLKRMMAEARDAVRSFETNYAGELAAIAAQLDGQLVELARRRQRVRAALPQVESRAAAIAERMARSIVALQINDLTAQRLDHARAALAMMPPVIDPARATGDIAWAADLDEENRAALFATVTSLQAQQIDQAGRDFLAAMREIKDNLSTLAVDSSAFIGEAGNLFGGETGDRTYIQGLEDNVQRASTLIDHFCESDRQVSRLIIEVSQVFESIAEELTNLRSIDADLRIMGLNATLKCSRLGDAGLTLGVVAQELRASSHRTEEASRQITETIESATAEATALADRSEQGHEAAAALSQVMADSRQTIGSLVGLIDTTLTRFVDTCGGVPDLLHAAIGDFTLDAVAERSIATITTDLNDLAARTGATDHDPQRVRDAIKRLLGGQYTMASERLIHDLYAEDDPAPAPSHAPAPPPPGGDELDAFFL